MEINKKKFEKQKKIIQGFKIELFNIKKNENLKEITKQQQLI